MYSSEEKGKLDKMNMVLNNLEQKLNCDIELCKKIANLIDMTIETNKLEERLSQVETHIPVIKQKIKDLVTSCNSSCNESRKDVLLSINKTLPINKDEEKTEKYISKIRRTIDCCIEEYEIYIKSTYYSKYHVGNSENDVLGMRISDLIIL